MANAQRVSPQLPLSKDNPNKTESEQPALYHIHVNSEFVAPQQSQLLRNQTISFT